ncbi:MAG: 16S rRNA (cytidine(1402)-2'-O)-methyltransferase [Nitrospirota bacterium]
MAGTLYLVSTPIGNVEDVTLRALRVLREAAIIAAEDPQQTRLLLDRYGIEASVTSYHNLNKETKAPVLIASLREGRSVALVSDAGTPLVADPGSFLVGLALDAGIRVVPIPGPSALLAALSASGLPCDAFLFHAAMPKSRSARRRLLRSLRGEPRTLVLFESADRLRGTLEAVRALFGPRRLALAKDLTTPHETFLRGTAQDLLAQATDRPFTGEVTIVVEGKRPARKTKPARRARRAVKRRSVS